MNYKIYGSGDVIMTTDIPGEAYITAVELIKKKARNEVEYTNWIMELKDRYNQDTKSYGVGGILWVEGR